MIPAGHTEPEAFRDVRAEAWRYALACLQENRRAKKEVARPGDPDDGTKSKEDSANEQIIQQSA